MSRSLDKIEWNGAVFNRMGRGRSKTLAYGTPCLIYLHKTSMRRRKTTVCEMACTATFAAQVKFLTYLTERTLFIFLSQFF